MEAKHLCISCGVKLKAFKYKGKKVAKTVITADGNPAEWGPYGDNVACTMECRSILLDRLIQSIPGVIDLLPPNWRLDKLDIPIDEHRARSHKKSDLQRAKRKRNRRGGWSW